MYNTYITYYSFKYLKKENGERKHTYTRKNVYKILHLKYIIMLKNNIKQNSKNTY